MLHTSSKRREECQVQPEKTLRERAEDLISLLVPDWRPTPRQSLWIIRIGIVLGLLFAIGYIYGVTLWDWIKLLIVPAVIAAGGLWFNVQQRDREQKLAKEHAQDEALQAYLDQMRQLLLDKEKPLRQSKEGDEVSTLARALTLTSLSQLDGKRKGTIIQFLSEARLIQGTQGMAGLGSGQPGWAQRRPIIGLTSADLSDIDLSDADLNYVILGEANLSGANLRGADLSNAILFNTDLTDADLSDATVSWWGGLNSCKSLKGATMPNGQKYEDWIVSKDRADD
jgi:Pentapeptide repeats (8 copies)